MLLAAFVLLIGALIAALNLASGYVFGNIFGYSIALWGAILGTMFLSLGFAVLITGPLARRARGRRLVCFLAFISGVMVFTLAFLEPKAAIEIKAMDMRAEFQPMVAAFLLLFLPNFLMSMIIPVIAGIAVQKTRVRPAQRIQTPEPKKPDLSNAAELASTEPPEEEAIHVDAIPEDDIRVLEVEKTGPVKIDENAPSKGKQEEEPVDLKIKHAAQGPPPVVEAEQTEIDRTVEARIRYELLRRHEALSLFGFALGAFTTLIAVSILGDPWLVLTVVGMVLLLVAFFGAAFLVKSLVTASLIAYFILSATVFVELAPSPGFMDRVLAAEEAKMRDAEKTELEADSLEVKRLSPQKVKAIFNSISDEVRAASDKSIALTLIIDILDELGYAVISGSDLVKVVDELLGDSEFRSNIMPFIEDIKSVKRCKNPKHPDRDHVVVSLRQRRDGSHSAVMIPREDGSTLKLVMTRLSFTIGIEKKGNTTIVEFGPYQKKPGFINPKHITPLKAIDVLGPIDAILISLKIWNKDDEVILFATGQGPVGDKKEVEITRISKDGRGKRKSSRRRGIWNKLIGKLHRRDRRL